jgi:hypothetical protein
LVGSVNVVTSNNRDLLVFHRYFPLVFFRSEVGLA